MHGRGAELVVYLTVESSVTKRINMLKGVRYWRTRWPLRICLLRTNSNRNSLIDLMILWILPRWAIVLCKPGVCERIRWSRVQLYKMIFSLLEMFEMQIGNVQVVTNGFLLEPISANM